MTGEPVQVDAGDFRRALTLIVHAMRSDEAGMRDVIDDESVPSGRLVPLVRASVSILWQLAPKIRDTAAVAQMLDTLARVADTEERSARDRAVARLAVAHPPFRSPDKKRGSGATQVLHRTWLAAVARAAQVARIDFHAPETCCFAGDFITWYVRQ